MAHPDGELATSRACAKAGVNMGISSFANYGVKDIREAGLGVGPIKHAMQMYVSTPGVITTLSATRKRCSMSETLLFVR